MSQRICLVTTGQPATNPRLVKEADALTAAGYRVHVIGAFAGAWAMAAERELMAHRRWTLDVVDWRRETSPWLYWRSRVRHRCARRAAGSPRLPIGVSEDAIARPSRELRARARRHAAALYIAHNLGALPAAARAARRHGSRLAFDAEDFHSGQIRAGEPGLAAATARVEREYLPLCDLVTASSPFIADAYRPLVQDRKPLVVLNVASRRERVEGHEAPINRVKRPGDALRLYWFSQTIGPHRGLEDAVRAMGMISGGVELHLRGTWAEGYETALRELARQCGVAAGSVIAHAPASPARMVGLAEGFDIGLALEPGDTPNSAFAISNKWFTYLMAGIAVIASRTPAQQWVMERTPQVGWSYHPGSAIELAHALRACVADPVRLAQARMAARTAADTQFCWEVEQGPFLARVADLLGPGRAAVRPRAGLAPASVSTEPAQ